MSTEGSRDGHSDPPTGGTGSRETDATRTPASGSGATGSGSSSGTARTLPSDSGGGDGTGPGGATGTRLSAEELRSITEAVIAAIHTSEASAPGTEGLPVDPSLTLSSGDLPLHSSAAMSAVKEIAATSLSVASTCLVDEGLPPIPTKLVEKIRRWEFIDLSLLLHDPSSKSEESLVQQQGSQIMIFQSVEQAQKRRKQITDIVSWIKAFSIYSAVLAAAEETTREEVVGLLAHMHLITQLSRDLAGGRWISYDSEFRAWAAAKGVRKWGELNIIIYGRCLPIWRTPGAPPSPSPPSSQLPSSKGLSSKRPKSSQKVCFQWNFSSVCERAESCRFSHACYYCGDPSHRGLDCGKRSRKERSATSSE
ncbi:PREDICTED: uncharacterized protein LOC109586769 [Amphimedon queenslandica]|uniref:C3H1-type domain-containing protein n=1 Tax=Amphimedon queenslandica TaxID=400682 RepID=A0A1X7TPG8_AMPQE|nr:PREDICTED: uncharacterized protein LOC109586769 [Amphimedon queenslandica]|eukprot:XP_019858533.1 PREDICTED: uncharacterized protein LOC109586769 [Amphimedon queenslandica]